MKSTSVNTKQTDEQAVARYLAENPNFFANRDDLLLKMRVPHQTRGDVSLLEKQVSLLQERQQNASGQLKELVHSAESNMEIYDKSRQLVLDLIAAKDMGEMLALLDGSFRQDFNCTACGMIVFSASEEPISDIAALVPLRTAEQKAGSLLNNQTPTLGPLRPEEREFLFRAQGKQVQSALVLPLCNGNDQLLGLLAIGSDDPNFFAADMDTLFISFVADAVARSLPRHLPGKLPEPPAK